MLALVPAGLDAAFALSQDEDPTLHMAEQQAILLILNNYNLFVLPMYD